MTANRSSASSRRDTALVILLLALILGLAAGVRVYRLGDQSLWADEGNSAAMTGRTLAEITQRAADDIHPPLYYWLLRLWAQAAGSGEAGLRSLSVVLGVLLVLAVYLLGHTLCNTYVGLTAALVATVSPFQVYYSQEARMYILLALEAGLAVSVFWWMVRQEDRRLPGQVRLLPVSGQLAVLIWAAGLYTHYAFPLMIGLLTLLYAGWLVYSRQRGRVGRRLLRWGLLLALSLGLYAPWLPIAFRQLAAWPTGGTATDVAASLRTSLNILSLGPILRGQATEWWVWPSLALALVGAIPWRNLHRRPGWLSWLIPLAWTAAPVAMMWGLGLFREAYLKFLLLASPAWSLLLARSVVGPAQSLAAPPGGPGDQTRYVTPWLRNLLGVGWVMAGLGLIGGLSGAVLSRYFTDPTVARDDYRSIAQFIEATAGPNDAILLNAPGQSEVFAYYYTGNLPVYALPHQRPLDPIETEGALARLLDHEKVYAVYWATEEADPKGLIQKWMNDHGYKTVDQWRGNVRQAVYVMPERRPADEVAEGLNLRFGSDILLENYRGWNLKPTAGQVTQLQLRWKAERTPTRRYKVFLQLLDGRDQVIAQRDSEPVGDSRPTDTWQPGEAILDNHGLLIPPGTPPGTYRRIIGLYDRDTGERLRLPDGSDFLALPPLTVQRAATPPPLAALNMRFNQRFDFGGITLLGYDRYKRGFGHQPDAPICPGDRLHLTFYWQANVQPRADWWFDLTLSDKEGHLVAHLKAPLVDKNYPTTLWQRGEIVRGEHDLLIPADLPLETYRLSLTLLPDEETLAGAPAYLGTIKVVEK